MGLSPVSFPCTCLSSFRTFLTPMGRPPSLLHLPGGAVPRECSGVDPVADHPSAGDGVLTVAVLCSQVSRHLTKLFDSLAKLKFQEDADKKPLKVAHGMFSRDGEYMDFDADCDLSGQVS